MVKRVLLIAYHYPPVRVSSGIQRTLTFSRYLPEFGWQPAVLSVHPRAYLHTSSDQLSEIPDAVTVKRAFALDTARHLAIRGRYFGWMAWPDRWVSWWFGGVAAGLRMIRRERPAVLLSTYPIATAHLIGLTLHRLTGIPWIADCRDSMTEPHYPRDPGQRRVFLWLERQAVRYCQRMVFTTPGTRRMYAERYPDTPTARWAVIGNGYDEENFRRAAQRHAATGDTTHDRVVLVHSGVLYPSERDPRPFYAALARLKKRGVINHQKLHIILRATGHDDYHRRHIEQYGIQDLVSLMPIVPYETALQEMLNANGLLLFQAANCNHQIPAKAYEYLRARRPLLALTDRAGDTAALLQQCGIDSIVALADSEDIERGFERFLGQLGAGTAPVADEQDIVLHSRRVRSQELAALLDRLVEDRIVREAGAQGDKYAAK